MPARSSSKHPKLVLGTFGPRLLGGSFVLAGREAAAHKHVMGTTGMGKSKFLASLFLQLVNQGVGAALIDPHADLARETVQLLLDTGFYKAADAYDRVLYIDFSRTDRFLPFNVLNQPYAPHVIARNTAEVCKRAWPALADGAAPQFENVLLASVLVLIENHLPLTAMPRLIADARYRAGLLSNVSDVYALSFFRDRFDRWGKEAPMMIESTLRRIFLLTFTPTMRYTLGQRDNSLNFRKLMDRNVSVIYNLGGLSEEDQRFLGCLLTVGYETAALSREDVPESERAPCHLLIDEYSMFSATSEQALARVLSLCRKYGLTLTLSNQTESQVSERLQGALQNCISIAFRLGRTDAQAAAPKFGKFDPYQIKHQVADPQQVDRSHPVFFSMQETFEAWAQELETLRPRQAYVKVGQRTAKIRTLEVPRPRGSGVQLAAVLERYAEMLLTPLDEAARQAEVGRAPTVGATARKVPL